MHRSWLGAEDIPERLMTVNRGALPVLDHWRHGSLSSALLRAQLLRTKEWSILKGVTLALSAIARAFDHKGPFRNVTCRSQQNNRSFLILPIPTFTYSYHFYNMWGSSSTDPFHSRQATVCSNSLARNSSIVPGHSGWTQAEEREAEEAELFPGSHPDYARIWTELMIRCYYHTRLWMWRCETAETRMKCEPLWKLFVWYIFAQKALL